MQFRAADLGELEEIVDELAHALCRSAYSSKIVRGRVVQPAFIVLEQGLAEAVDASERSPEIVRYRIAERLELLVLPLELVDKRRPRLGKLRCRPGSQRLDLLAEQLLSDATVLVLELLPPNLRADPCGEHLEIARLLDVIVSPCTQCVDHGRAVFESCQHDEGHIPHDGNGFDPSTGFVATETRHEEVEKNAVDGLSSNELERLLTRMRHHDVVPLAA